MESATESNLIAKLQSSDLTNIYHLFATYLHPFTPFLDPPIPKKTKKSSKTVDSDNQSTLRSLAKQFLPFLNRTLSIVPKRLSETPKVSLQFAVELFDIYKLCLNCLDSIASQLSCKPYSVHIQRVRLIHCFEAWERYKDAESEGFSVLESIRIRGIGFGGGAGGLGAKRSKAKEQLIPELNEECIDQEFAVLVVEIVVTLVKCASVNQSKEVGDYKRVLALVHQVMPWFRVLDANMYEKMHRVLVTYLGKCTAFLVGEPLFLDRTLMRDFCLATFAEYAKSSKKYQIHKFARRICSSLFLLQDSGSLHMVDILICLIDYLVGEFKVGIDNPTREFLEVIDYFANKCQIATSNLRGVVAAHLNKIADDLYQVSPSLDLIMRIYAAGLVVSNFSDRLTPGDSTTAKDEKDGSFIKLLLDNEGSRQRLTVLLASAECKKLVHQLRSQVEAKYKASILCTSGDLLSYYHALRFLCQPLAEFINSEKKTIVTEIEDASVSTKLCTFQEVFCLFCDVFLSSHSASEMETDASDDDYKVLLSVAVAAFTVSVSTKHNTKESLNFLKHIISTEHIQVQGLKYLFASLYNVGVIFYRNKHTKEASEAFELSCRASWNCVLRLCEVFAHKSNGIHIDLTEDAIVSFVAEACAKSAFLLDVFYECGSNKVNAIIGDILEGWSVAQNLFKTLPVPIAVVKQWVKIECKHFKDMDLDHGATTLYSFLSSSLKISKKALGMLLEQELLAYGELNALNPRLCQRMRMEIIDILLEQVYVTNDSFLQKFNILLRKGRELRAHGIEYVNKSVQCLSDAISMMSGMRNEILCCSVQAHHQLAVAYCLRALSTQEAEPDSKQFVQDIRAALNLLLTSDHCHGAILCNVLSEKTSILLYYIVDLLSVKGHIELHSEIYEVLIRCFKQKNIPLEKFLAVLWECRRLGHALCGSPVYEAFITTLSHHCGELSKSMIFWISCMKESLPLLVGLQLNFSLMFASCPWDSSHFESSFPSNPSNITVDEVRKAASDLISSVPLCCSSVFLAANLYYDLCERLMSNGQLIEALFYAKEAHRLRSKLLQENFMYSIEQQNEIYNETGEIIQKRCYVLRTFLIHNSVATAAWLYDDVSCNLEGSILTPWNVLQCYLESTLQVGIIQERLGNGSEAETLLLWGKNISSFQSLPLFIVAFSSSLGKLYCKQGLWDLAENELSRAKQTLADSCSILSCWKCRVVLEVVIDQQLGDLCRSRCASNLENLSIEGLSCARSIYESALDKLNLCEWKNSVSYPEEASEESTTFHGTFVDNSFGAKNSCSKYAADCSVMRGSLCKSDKPKATMETRRSRKAKNVPKALPQGQCVMECNLRVTRSRSRSLQNGNKIISGEVQVGSTKDSTDKQVLASPDAFWQREPQSEITCSVPEPGCGFTCICNKMRCWFCLPLEVMKSGSVNNFVQMKWEFVRRRLSLRLFIGIGKCVGLCGDIHEAHEVFLRSISALLSRSSFGSTCSSISPTFLLDLIEKDVTGDPLAVERAAILYNICWFALKSYSRDGTRISCCDLSHIEIPRIVSWLKLAFILCSEVPVLSQKVSRLLSVLYILSASIRPFSLHTSPCTALSDGQWAAYFHQASLGTHLNHQLFSSIFGKQKALNPMDLEGSYLGCPTSVDSDMLKLLRLAPQSQQDLDGFVLRFFQGLPSTTIICLSLLGDVYASLLSQLLNYPSSIHAWILLSRLKSSTQPVVILLPVDVVLEEAQEDDEKSGVEVLFESTNFANRWHCPWGFTVVDDVAPMFRSILEENYLSSSIYPLEDTKKNRSLWWMQRKRLDLCLGKFLGDLEASWFGSWKYLLLGELSECKNLDSVLKKLVDDLKIKYGLDVCASLLKVILGGAKYVCEGAESVLQFIMNKGCYIGEVGHSNHESSRILSANWDGDESLSQLVFKLIFETACELEEAECVNREPIILVLDFDVQMLPWESLPILRNQEVYRLPSVGSIFATLCRCCNSQEQVESGAAGFPLIDPLDAYYLLNPGGDLSSTQVEFESWFRDQKFEGRTGAAPSIEELSVALKSHDLFIYFGHGSGAQYIPGHEVQKLESCAATLLMGCSSGSLSLNGCYTPQGAPLSYVLAGSPIIIANLWEVTDKDIDRFGKAILDGWLRERSMVSVGCSQCNIVSEEFNTMNLHVTKQNGKKKMFRKKLPKACNFGVLNDSCNHRPKIGSFMGQAREACNLPFLIGASPVCYGVPTGIGKRRIL